MNHWIIGLDAQGSMERSDRVSPIPLAGERVAKKVISCRVIGPQFERLSAVGHTFIQSPFPSRQRVAETDLGKVKLGAPVEGLDLDVNVRRLRAKVDDPFDRKLIHTVRGVGYVLEERP